MISPNTTLINAAINELPILVINAFLTVSFDINVKNSFGDNFSAYANTDANGISTINDNIVTVTPIVNPNPGMTLAFFAFFNVLFSLFVLLIFIPAFLLIYINLVKQRSIFKIFLVSLIPSSKITDLI